MIITIYTLSSSRNPEEIKYVGKTKQTLKRRLQGHICSAKKSKLNNYVTNHNYNWINKEIELGNEILIDYVDEMEFEEGEKWDWFEIYWIQQFKNWGFDLTNIKKGGEDNHYTEPSEEVIRKRAEKIIGKPRSETTKQKISESTTGKIYSDSTIKKIKDSITSKQGRPVYQCDIKTGEIIKEWSSGAEAARELDLDKANLNSCCRGKKKSCGGYKWIYVDPEKTEYHILQYSEDGKFIKEFRNSAEAERELGINSVLINRVCKGLQPKTYNFIFKYKIVK